MLLNPVTLTQKWACFTKTATRTIRTKVLGMSCPSWQWQRTGYCWSPVRPLPVAPLWCELGSFSRTVVVIKLRRTSAFKFIHSESMHRYVKPVNIFSQIAALLTVHQLMPEWQLELCLGWCLANFLPHWQALSYQGESVQCQRPCRSWAEQQPRSAEQGLKIVWKQQSVTALFSIVNDCEFTCGMKFLELSSWISKMWTQSKNQLFLRIFGWKGLWKFCLARSKSIESYKRVPLPLATMAATSNCLHLRLSTWASVAQGFDA